MDTLCEARTPACTGRAVHKHHRKLRSQGGTDHPTNLLFTCFPCHHYIHMNPAISYANGWLIHSWDTVA